MSIKIRVGHWYNKFDDKQKKAMIIAIQHDIDRTGRYVTSDFRKFLTTAKKFFADDIKEYYPNSAIVILKDNSTWAYTSPEYRKEKPFIKIK